MIASFFSIFKAYFFFLALPAVSYIFIHLSLTMRHSFTLPLLPSSAFPHGFFGRSTLRVHCATAHFGRSTLRVHRPTAHFWPFDITSSSPHGSLLAVRHYEFIAPRLTFGRSTLRVHCATAHFWPFDITSSSPHGSLLAVRLWCLRPTGLSPRFLSPSRLSFGLRHCVDFRFWSVFRFCRLSDFSQYSS